MRRPLKALALLPLLVASLPALAQPLPGQPSTQFDFPVESPGVPAYARFELLLPNFDLPNDRQWAAVVFYRDPACVPPEFNLGDFFDLPGPGGLGAFACPLLIEGHEIWRNGPAEDLAPQYVLSRNAVPALPVWFVRWEQLIRAIHDGVLTMGELEDMSSLKRGHARWFEERLYPNGGADAPGISLRAEGSLEEGGWFELAWDYADFGEVDEVTIRLQGPR
jgi:hypothetical protein